MGLGTFINDNMASWATARTILDYCGAVVILSSSFGLLPKSFTKSVRTQETSYLKSLLHKLSDSNYIVVTGEKGIGKSCLIDTALRFTFGVVKVDTKSGEDQDEIIKKVLREITNIRLIPFDLSMSSERVLFCYKLFFRSNPVAVISVPERRRGAKYSDVTAAVRILADKFQLRVIVDGCPNSIPIELLNTKREIVMYVHSMKKNDIENIPQLKVLINFLKFNKLDQVVFDVLGGSPADYITLRNLLLFNSGTTEVQIKLVKNHIKNCLKDALNNIAKSSQNTKDIIQVLRRRGVLGISLTVLEDEQLLLLEYSSPNMVLKEVTYEDDILLEPATPAIGLIIKHNIKNSREVMKLADDLFTAL